MYKAVVCKIKAVRPHSNADRLRLGSAAGFQVILGLETLEGTLGLFFPTDGALSLSFAEANDLIHRTNPETGAREGGLFDKNCRVRAQKLRGEISEGFWCDLSYLQKVSSIKQTTIEALKDGDEVSELDGVEICHKYVTRATRANSSMSKGTGSLKKKNPRFPEHMDTRQFRTDAAKIPQDSIIYLSEKMHGTSGRYANALTELPLTRWQRLKKVLGLKVKPQMAYQYTIGTRRVVLKKEAGCPFYGDDFRNSIMNASWHLLKKGEILYGEIVGWTSTGAAIQPAAKTKCLKDKEFTKRYGEVMNYKYGCPQGTCKFFIYRIAYANEDGHIVELSWPQVKKRAGELGFSCVPDLYEPILPRYCDAETLQKLVREKVIGPSLLDDSQIREGVCLRIESQNPLMILKEKSAEFRMLEDGVKSDEAALDIEEQQEFMGGQG